MLHRFLLSASIIVLLSGSALAQAAKAQDSKPVKAVQPSEKVEADDRAKPKEAEVTLKVGGKAPPIHVEKWVKGEEVKAFEKGKVYVVEFWATWCTHCKGSIPHLTELAKANKGVTFIGVAASERKEQDVSDKRLENLTSFVTRQGDAMGYHVAYDSDRKMGAAWMKASGTTDIPAAFIVDGEGKIAWIGHPMEMDSHLANAVKSAKPAKIDDAKKQESKKKSKAKEKAVKGKG